MAGERASRSKLWVGTTLMCAALLVWVLAVKLMVNRMPMPDFKSDPTSSDFAAQLAKLKSPTEMMDTMVIAFAVRDIVFVIGAVVAGMGMIDYAAEVRRRA